LLATLVAATLMLSAAALRAQEPPRTGSGAAHGKPRTRRASGRSRQIFNFAVLAGVLVYYLRTPTTNYLASRKARCARPRHGRADEGHRGGPDRRARRELKALPPKSMRSGARPRRDRG
jgi:hypothetical protein